MSSANTLEVALRIIAAVDGINDIKSLTGQSEELDRVIADLSQRARDSLNYWGGFAEATRSAGESVRAATEPVEDVVTRILKLSAALSAAGAGMAALAYNESKSFETALATLNRVLSESDGPVSGYVDSLKQLGVVYGESTTGLASRFAEIIQSGYKGKVALDMLASSLKLVRAGDIEAEQATSLLLATLAGFSVPADQAAGAAERLGDILNATANNYNTDVQQLAEGMAALSPIAKQAGLSMEETAGVLTPVIEVFGSGSEAANALKTGLLKLADDSAPVRAALNALGVAQTDATGQLRSGRDILLDVALAFQGLDDAQKLAVTSQLVGVDQAARMVKVFDGLHKSLEVTQNAMESTGSMQREVDIALQTSEVVVRRTAESFRQLAETMGTGLREPVTGVVDATGALARAFDEAARSGAFKSLASAVGAQLGAIEEMFRKIAANIPEALSKVDFSRLSVAIHQLGAELGDVFGLVMGGIDLTSVDGLTRAFQMAADGVSALAQFTAGALDQMEPLFYRFGYWATTILENAEAFARTAGEIGGLITTVNTLIPIYTELAARIFDAVEAVGSFVFKVGLAVGAIKLLNAAGIDVLPMLGALIARLGSLGAGTASVAAAFAGLPGLVVGLVTASAGAGVALGLMANKAIEAASGGRSLGVLLYDLAEGFGLTGDEAASSAVQIDAHALAQRKAAQAAEEARKAAEAKRTEDEKARALANEQAETNRRLSESFASVGLILDKNTGELRKNTEFQNENLKANFNVQQQLKKLGIDYKEFAGQVTDSGDEIIKAFRAITWDATSSTTLIRTSLVAALAKAETQAEIDKLKGLWNEYAQRVGMSQQQAADAFALAADAAKKSAEKAIDAAEAETQAVEGNSRVKLANAQAALDIARASGNEQAVRRATIALAKAEADAAEAVAAAKRNEVAAADALVLRLQREAEARKPTQEQQDALLAAQQSAQAKRNEADAADASARAKRAEADAAARASVATKGHTQASAENAQALEQQSQAASSAGGIAQMLSQKLNNARAEMRGLSAAAGEYFEQAFLGAQSEVGLSIYFQKLKPRISDVSDELERLKFKIGEQGQLINAAKQWAAFGDSISDYEAAIALAAARTRIAYYEQQADAERLARALDNVGKSGTAHMYALEGAARALSGELGLLNENDLSRLRGALDDANNRLREMQELAATAAERLSELKAENLELSGNKEQAELLRLQNEYTQDALALESELAKAKATNNRDAIRDLEQSINLLKQNLDLKERDIRAENNGKNKSGSTNSDNDATDSKSTGKSKSSNGSGGGVSGGGSLSADDIAAALKRAGVVNGGIDYERLATAMAQRPIAIDERALTSSVLRTLKNDSMRSS